ncbi:MAG: ABC transporter permease [Lachnospiraceae bacterium]|nr:ABC transporter permease [Lachnospiraceae bacterium]
MQAIYKKEMKAYLHSVVGWLFMAFLTAFIGLYFFYANLLNGSPYFGYSLYSVSLIFVLTIPLLSMRIMAEENKLKTDQLLLTAPVKTWKIVVGKYLSMVTLFTIVMLASCILPLIMTKYGTVNLKMSYVGILGFYLLGCAYMAIGLFISGITENQAMAAILTFVFVLATQLSDSIVGLFNSDSKSNFVVFTVLAIAIAGILYLSMKNIFVSAVSFIVIELVMIVLYLVNSSIFDGLASKLVTGLSLVTPFADMVSGVFELKSVVFFLSVIIVFLYLADNSLKKRRFN